MGKVAISPGFDAIFVALGRFLFAAAFLAERADAATRILLAAGLFTIAIAAVVRNENDGRSSAYFSYGARQTN